MKAVVFDDVPEPKIQTPDDAIIRVMHSAICGTDLHMVRGILAGMQPGTILGHEAVGVVEETGSRVRNFLPGERVVVPSTIACGQCAYCRNGYYAQCDEANPHGKLASTAFLGEAELTDVIAAYESFDTRQAGWVKVELVPSTNGSGTVPRG